MTLVPEQIDVLFAVLTLDMVFADLLPHMLLITVFTAKHSTTIYTKPPTVRHTLLVGAVALRTHAGTIMVFSVVAAFLTNLAIETADEVSRHCGDEVIVVLAQKDIDFLQFFDFCSGHLAIIPSSLSEKTLIW